MAERFNAEKNWKSLMRGELRGLPKSYQPYEEMGTPSTSANVVNSLIGLWKMLRVPDVSEVRSEEDLLAIALSGIGGMIRKAGKRGPGFRKLMAEEWRKRGAPVSVPPSKIDSVLAQTPTSELQKLLEPGSDLSVRGRDVLTRWLNNKDISDKLNIKPVEYLELPYAIKKTATEIINKLTLPRSENPLDKVHGLIDFVSRGLWWHGRRTYPKAGETFVGARVKSGNLGEPWGMSLAADPKVSIEKGFAKSNAEYVKMLDALRKAQLSEFKKMERRNPSIDSTQTLLPISPAYAAIRKKITDIEGKIRAPARVFPIFGGAPSTKVLPAWKGPGTEYAQEIFKDSYVKGLREQPRIWEKKGALKEDWRSLIDAEQHQKFVSQDLLSRGYKALLYSPERYEEYELRMLDPADVRMMDIRSPGDRALEKLYSDVNRPKGRQKMRMTRWEDELEGLPSSLGDIYKDIDLRALTLEGEGVPRAKPGVGEFSDLDTLDMPDFAGMGEIPEPKMNLDELIHDLTKDIFK